MSDKTSADYSRTYRDKQRGGPPRVPEGCPSHGAIKRHIKAGEPLCDDCAQFRRDYNRRAKQISRQNQKRNS